MIDFCKKFIWYNYGMFNFLKDSYEKNSKTFKPFDDVDVNGMSFMVTGGTSGIGLSVVRSLIEQKGTIVHIICKNQEKTEKVNIYLKKIAHVDSKFLFHIVDLSSPKHVAFFAGKFIEYYTKIDINNIGCFVNEFTLGEFDIESSFAINVLGPYILTKMLLFPMLKNSNVNKKRVIFVSCSQLLMDKFNGNNHKIDEYNYDPYKLHAYHKKQLLVMCKLFAKNFPEVQFSSMHPGWVDTPGLQKSNSFFYDKFKEQLRSPDQGADTIIWLSLSNEAISFPNGTFFFDRSPSRTYLFGYIYDINKKQESKFLYNLNYYCDIFTQKFFLIKKPISEKVSEEGQELLLYDTNSEIKDCFDDS